MLESLKSQYDEGEGASHEGHYISTVVIVLLPWLKLLAFPPM